MERPVEIPAGSVGLPGDLAVPSEDAPVVVFAHGSGSSRLSPRNRAVARALDDAGLGTLLFDLLTPAEADDRANVFDIELLAARLDAATSWVRASSDAPVGYFGASTGAAAALWAAAARDDVAAIVSRGGRPDLAGPRLADVRAPTLMVVGGWDEAVIEMNREAQRALRCESELVVIPRAGHLFEEPGALEEVAERARDWFKRWMARA